MVNQAERFEHIASSVKAEREKIEQEIKTLRDLEDKTDEIRDKIDRLEEQDKILKEVQEAVDDMAEGFGEIDKILEYAKQFLPIIKGVGAGYGTEIGGILSELMATIGGISEKTLANREELYDRRAQEMMVYFNSLTKAGFPENVAAEIVAKQGAPYSLEQMLLSIFDKVRIEFDLS